MSRVGVTALIPAHNDDYTLDLCLRSIAPYVARVLVLDDCSTDHTPDVVADVRAQHAHVRYFRHEGRQLGWIEARNLLLSKTDDDRLLWLDADDVLFERNAGILRDLVEGAHARPVVRLQLCEFWGDLNHTTQRLRHYDRCHVYVDRRSMRDFAWRGGPAARPETSVSAGRSEGPLFAHLKGVKSDRRLVERQFIRAWLRQGRPTPTVAEFARLDEPRPQAGGPEPAEGRDPEWIHQRAMQMLFDSRQDILRKTYSDPVCGLLPLDGSPPRRPRRVIGELKRGQRFHIVYEGQMLVRNGKPCDRLDTGWRCDRKEPPDAA